MIRIMSGSYLCDIDKIDDILLLAIGTSWFSFLRIKQDKFDCDTAGLDARAHLDKMLQKKQYDAYVSSMKMGGHENGKWVPSAGGHMKMGAMKNECHTYEKK